MHSLSSVHQTTALEQIQNCFGRLGRILTLPRRYHVVKYGLRSCLFIFHQLISSSPPTVRERMRLSFRCSLTGARRPCRQGFQNFPCYPFSHLVGMKNMASFMISTYPPVIACLKLDLKVGFSASLTVELGAIWSPAMRARAASYSLKCFTLEHETLQHINHALLSLWSDPSQHRRCRNCAFQPE